MQLHMLGSNTTLPADQAHCEWRRTSRCTTWASPGPTLQPGQHRDRRRGANRVTRAQLETNIIITSTLTPANGNMLFPLASASNRFHVIPASEKKDSSPMCATVQAPPPATASAAFARLSVTGPILAPQCEFCFF